MKPAANREVILKRVNLWWYPLTLLPIVMLGYAAVAGWVPQLFAVLAVFLLFFWLFSLIFALVALVRKPQAKR